VESVDAQQAVADSRLMADRVSSSIRNPRYVATLLGAFALAALLLATLGIFGLVSYSTSQRTRELGIRMALGSTPGAVVRLVMRGGLRLLGAGIVIGLAGAALIGRVLASRVDGVHAFDLSIYAAIAAVLGLTGILASLVPAWRAVRIPPASALRYE
jgi:putative ABC transport system permease protein